VPRHGRHQRRNSRHPHAGAPHCSATRCVACTDYARSDTGVCTSLYACATSTRFGTALLQSGLASTSQSRCTNTPDISDVASMHTQGGPLPWSFIMAASHSDNLSCYQHNVQHVGVHLDVPPAAAAQPTLFKLHAYTSCWQHAMLLRRLTI
jgi:hypothetical protein